LDKKIKFEYCKNCSLHKKKLDKNGLCVGCAAINSTVKREWETSSTVNKKDSNFFTPEFLLRRLLLHFSNLGSGFEWNHIEGTTIRNLEGLKFENRIKEYVENKN